MMHWFSQTIIIILLSSQIALSNADSPAPIDLTHEVQQMRQQLPQQLAENLLLTDVNYNQKKQMLIFSTTVVDTKKDQISEDSIINQTCFTPKLRSAIDQGITVSFFYYALNKELIKHTVVTKDLCTMKFQEFENLLITDIQQLNNTILPETLTNQLILFHINYQPINHTLSAKIKPASDTVNIDTITKKDSINLACSYTYFEPLIKKNISISLNYFDKDGKKLLKTISVEPMDCLSKNTENEELTDPLDKQLYQDANMMKKNLKNLSTNQIELTDVGYNPERRIVWNKATIKDPKITKDQLNPTLTIASLCNKSTTRQTINKGISYEYSYYSPDDTLIMHFIIDQQTCKNFDQTYNLLLQQ